MEEELGLGQWHELAGDCGTQEAAWKSLVRIEANSGHADPEGPQGPGQEAAWSRSGAVRGGPSWMVNEASGSPLGLSPNTTVPGLKPQKLILSRLWKLESEIPGRAGRASPGAGKRVCPRPLPWRLGLAGLLEARAPAQHPPCVRISPVYKDTGHPGLAAHPPQAGPHLNDISVQVRLHSWNWRLKLWTHGLQGTQFNLQRDRCHLLG